MNKEYNTDFLDFLLKQDLEIQLYIGSAKCYPNENGKWNIFWKYILDGNLGGGSLTTKDLTSKQLIDAIMSNKLPEE
jgi:hypothetical protein